MRVTGTDTAYVTQQYDLGAAAGVPWKTCKILMEVSAEVVIGWLFTAMGESEW